MAPTTVIESSGSESDAGPSSARRPTAGLKRRNGVEPTSEDDAFIDDSDDPRSRARRRLSAAQKGKGKARAVVDDEEDEDLDDDLGEEELEDDEEYGDEVAGAGAGLDPSDSSKRKKKTTFSWEEEYTRSWDLLTEDAQGSLSGAVSAFLSNNSKRRRYLGGDAAAIQRGIIRHLYLILDLSESMNDKDMRPSRMEVTLKYAKEFVAEFFDQNPISQLAIIGMRDGMAERISPLGGNPVEHGKMLMNRKKLGTSGEPSLQNALNLARSGLSHLPTHGSREVVIIFGSLTTCDPGNIHDTIDALVKDRIRVNIIGLSAEMAVCREICKRTRGTFNVSLNEDHYKDLLFESILPPASLQPKAATAGSTQSTTDLMLMGFPTLLSHTPYPTLCACHSKLYKNKQGYICPRCGSKLCEVPTECNVCRLTIVSSPHLARSYRHLFPVQGWQEVEGAGEQDMPPKCFGCSVRFPPFSATSGAPPTATSLAPAQGSDGAAAQKKSDTGRYRCPRCKNQFCIDCDIFVHSLGTCPGCQ